MCCCQSNLTPAVLYWFGFFWFWLRAVCSKPSTLNTQALIFVSNWHVQKALSILQNKQNFAGFRPKLVIQYRVSAKPRSGLRVFRVGLCTSSYKNIISHKNRTSPEICVSSTPDIRFVRATSALELQSQVRDYGKYFAAHCPGLTEPKSYWNYSSNWIWRP